MSATLHATSFVLFPLGVRNFALAAEVVVELARPGRVHIFPHTTPELGGVLVRRGMVLPVWDVAPALLGCAAPGPKFYLIARRRFDGREEWTAIPVDGECRMVQADAQPCLGMRPAYVRGVVLCGEESVDVIDLERLADVCELSAEMPVEVAS